MTNNSRSVLALTSAASMMVALDLTVVATALSRIRTDLHASMQELEWTVNAYSLSFAVLLMSGAALGDRFGRRRVFTLGLGLFTLASVGCALTSDPGWLIAARAVQGSGSALVLPLAMALLSAAFPPERRARALGVFSGVTGLAVVIGPVIGGAVTQGLAWQWIFWFNVPFGLVVIPLAIRKIPESRGPGGRLDGGGLVLATAAALALVFGMIQTNVPALVAGPVLLAAFVAWELRAREPMIPMGLFRSRGFSAGNTAALMLYASLYGGLFFVSQYLQIGRGCGPFAEGVEMIAWSAAVTFVAPVSGALVNRIGPRRLTVAGLALQALAMGGLALVVTPDVPYWQVAVPLFVSGIGLSMAMPAVQTSVVNSVAPIQIGKASGVFNTLRQFGAALGVTVLSPVFTAVGGYATPRSFTDGFGAAMGVSAAMAAAGVVAALAIPGPARTPAAAPAAAPREAALR